MLTITGSSEGRVRGQFHNGATERAVRYSGEARPIAVARADSTMGVYRTALARTAWKMEAEEAMPKGAVVHPQGLVKLFDGESIVSHVDTRWKVYLIHRMILTVSWFDGSRNRGLRGLA